MFHIEETEPFSKLLKSYRKHRKLQDDLRWLKDKLAQDPQMMGDHVPELQGLKYPVFKARLKDSCCGVGQSFGWRVYYAVAKHSQKVYLVFLHHKREDGDADAKLLKKKISWAFD